MNKYETLIFNDDHQHTILDDHSRIYCPVKNIMFEVKSSTGDINMFCPGCGKELKEK